MHHTQGCCSHLGHGLWLGGQACEHTRTALSRLVKQKCLPLILLGQGLGHQLGLFDLESHFNAALEGCLQSGHGFQIQRHCGGQNQDVAVVFYEGNDLLVGHFVEQIVTAGTVIDGTRLVWQSAPTARGASLDELLQANIVVSAAHVQGQLPDLAATPTPVSAPEVTPAA